MPSRAELLNRLTDMISLENCSSIIEYYMALALISNLLFLFLSGLLVFSNEDGKSFKSEFDRRLRSGIHILYTSEHLNKTGKRWRKPFLTALALLLLYGMYSSFYGGICQ